MRHGEGLARAGDADQDLVDLAVVDALSQGGDRLRLVARRVVGQKLEWMVKRLALVAASRLLGSQNRHGDHKMKARQRVIPVPSSRGSGEVVPVFGPIELGHHRGRGAADLAHLRPDWGQVLLAIHRKQSNDRVGLQTPYGISTAFSARERPVVHVVAGGRKPSCSAREPKYRWPSIQGPCDLRLFARQATIYRSFRGLTGNRQQEWPRKSK